MPYGEIRAASGSQGDMQSVVLRKKAMALLARREHSRAELKQKLLSRGFAESDIEIVLNELAKQNLQSDMRFAEMYVNARKQAGFGPKKIIAELQARGISDDLIMQFVDDSANHWYENMTINIQKKFPKTHANHDQIAQFLLYRGYALDMIERFLGKDNVN